MRVCVCVLVYLEINLNCVFKSFYWLLFDSLFSCLKI